MEFWDKRADNSAPTLSVSELESHLESWRQQIINIVSEAMS